MHEAFAQDLKSKREAAGLSLQDLFGRTRINVHFLEAIETGEFDVLPEVYVRLFLRKYAQEIGLDAEVVTRQYEALTSGRPVPGLRARPNQQADTTRSGDQGEAPDKTPEPDTGTASGESPSSGGPEALLLDLWLTSRRRNRSHQTDSKAVMVVGGAVAVIAVVAIALMTSGQEPTSAENQGSASARARLTPSSGSGQDSAPSERVRSYAISLPSFHAEGDSLQLEASVIHRVGVTLTVDGQSALQQIVSPGDHFVWKARSRFLLEVDRSNALRLSLQGNPLGLSTEPGSSLKLFISPASVWVEESRSIDASDTSL